MFLSHPCSSLRRACVLAGQGSEQGFPFNFSTVGCVRQVSEEPSPPGWVNPFSPQGMGAAHMSHFYLPAAVLSSLRQLSVSTSILSDPACIPEQATRAVAGMGRGGSS